VSGLQNLPRLKRRVQIDRVGRIHERLASHSCRARDRERDNAVNDAEIQRARQCRLDRVQILLEHTQLVVLVRPLELVGDANSLLELERLERLHPGTEIRARLVLTLTNVLSFARVENDSLALTE